MIASVFLIAGFLGGVKLAAYLFLLFLIAIQAITLLHGINVFWTEYRCSRRNKVLFAFTAVVRTALMVWIGIYLLDLLENDLYDPWYIYIATFAIGCLDSLVSFAAKRWLLNVPFPWTT